MESRKGWALISEPERDRLLAVYQSRDFKALGWESQSCGVQINTLIRRLQEWQASKRDKIVENPMRPSWTTGFIRLETDNAVFISDWEVPDHDDQLFDFAKRVGRIYGIDTLILGGDMLASDQPGLTTHDATWETRQESYEDNVATLRKLVKDLSEVYTKRYAIEGNHDRRVSKITKGAVWYGMFMNDLGVECSRFPFLWCNTKTNRGLVRFTHPEPFSENAIGMGRTLIDKSRIKSHIVMAHTHQGQRGWSKDGQWEVVAAGCMRSPHKTQYKNIVDNKYGEWQPGFVMMLNGYFYLMNLYSTDWKRVLDGGLIT